MLEPDRGFMKVQAIFAAKQVYHASCGNGLYHPTAQPLPLIEVTENYGEYPVGGEKFACFINRTDPVGIPVQGQSHPIFSAPHLRGKFGQMLFGRLGWLPAKGRVFAAVNLFSSR